MTDAAELDSVSLHHEERGSGAPVLIAHGLLGSLSNWRSVARLLGDHFHVFSVDLRNHGRSPHQRPHTYEAMAADVDRFMDDQGLDRVILIGHSMGGRLAMHLALSRPERIRALCVLDVSPSGGPKSELREMLSLMRDFDPGACASRREAGEQLSQHIVDPALASSVLMNIGRRADGRLFWRPGLDELVEDFDRLRDAPPPGRFDGESLFIRGGASNYLPLTEREPIRDRFPRARLETLEGAGHLLHVDRPEELQALLLEFCTGLS